uniref:Putative secreted protein n=1 Tax=Ixodes ricinus TaxID=34613 RepID=A0A6B0UXS2_IXORI
MLPSSALRSVVRLRLRLLRACGLLRLLAVAAGFRFDRRTKRCFDANPNTHHGGVKPTSSRSRICTAFSTRDALLSTTHTTAPSQRSCLRSFSAFVPTMTDSRSLSKAALRRLVRDDAPGAVARCRERPIHADFLVLLVRQVLGSKSSLFDTDSVSASSRASQL